MYSGFDDHSIALANIALKHPPIGENPRTRKWVEAERVERLLGGLTVQVPKVGESYQRDQVAIRVVAASAHTTPNDSSISILASIEGLTIFAASDLELEG